MRMNPEAKVTAAELVNTMSGEQLERLFRTLGEEPAARRIATIPSSVAAVESSRT